MGLDIHTLRNPTFVKPRDETTTDGDWDTLHYVYNESCFEARADGHPPGFYSGDYVRHRGWSYGGYNQLREFISETAFGVAPDVVWKRPGPWHAGEYGALTSLINFSDCEGAIGPVTSGLIAEALRRLTIPADSEWADSVHDLATCLEDAAQHNGFAVWA